MSKKMPDWFTLYYATFQIEIPSYLFRSGPTVISGVICYNGQTPDSVVDTASRWLEAGAINKYAVSYVQCSPRADDPVKACHNQIRDLPEYNPYATQVAYERYIGIKHINETMEAKAWEIMSQDLAPYSTTPQNTPPR